MNILLTQQGPAGSCRQQSGKATLPIVVLLVLIAGVGITATVLLLGKPPKTTGEAPPPTQQEIDDRVGAIQQAFQSALQESRDLTRVQDQARLFTQEHPDQSSGHLLFAQIQMQLNLWESAYQSWTHTLELDPGVFEVHKMAGFCAAKRGRLEQAVEHYQDAVRVAGPRADNEVFSALGRLYLALDDPDAAEQAYNQALEAPGVGNKTNWKHGAYSGLADVAGVRGEFDQASAKIERAMRLAMMDSNADIVGYTIQRARLLMDRGQTDKAFAVLMDLGQTHSDAIARIESARLRARLYEQAGDLEKAVNHVAAICQLYQLRPDREDDKLGEFYALLAQWQIKAGRQDAARTSVHNLRTLLPDHPELSALEDAIAARP